MHEVLLKTYVADVFDASSVGIIKERLWRSWYRNGRRRRRRRRLRRWVLIQYWDDDAEGSEDPLSGAGSAAEPRRGSHCNTQHFPGTWGGLSHVLRPSTNRWSKKFWRSCLPLASFLISAIGWRSFQVARYVSTGFRELCHGSWCVYSYLIGDGNCFVLQQEHGIYLRVSNLTPVFFMQRLWCVICWFASSACCPMRHFCVVGCFSWRGEASKTFWQACPSVVTRTNFCGKARLMIRCPSFQPWTQNLKRHVWRSQCQAVRIYVPIFPGLVGCPSVETSGWKQSQQKTFLACFWSWCLRNFQLLLPCSCSQHY